MNFLILILCLFNTMIYSQTNFTEAEKDKFIQAVKKGDYSILLPFVKRDDISPYSWILNGNAVVKAAPFEVDKVDNESITIPFSFKQTGKVIGYTNQYEAEFINDQEILWDLGEIKSLPNAVCYGFYDMMKKAFKTKEPQKIINLYKDYSNDIMGYFRSSLISIVYKRLYFYCSRYEDRDIELSEEEDYKIADYLFSIMYPSKEQQRIFLLNLPLYRIGTRYNIHATEKCRSKNTITTPYNKEDPWRTCN